MKKIVFVVAVLLGTCLSLLAIHKYRIAANYRIACEHLNAIASNGERAAPVARAIEQFFNERYETIEPRFVDRVRLYATPGYPGMPAFDHVKLPAPLRVTNVVTFASTGNGDNPAEFDRAGIWIHSGYVAFEASHSPATGLRLNEKETSVDCDAATEILGERG